MLLSYVRFASPVWIGGGLQITEASVPEWAIREEPSGIFIQRGATRIWVPLSNVRHGIPVIESGEVHVVAVCTRCQPPRTFENLTALRSHERHVHRLRELSSNKASGKPDETPKTRSTMPTGSSSQG